MAYEGYQIIAPGLTAAADLSTSQYCVVFLSTNNTVNLATSTTAIPIGILQNKPSAAGQAAEVCIFGVSKARAGGTIAFTNFVRNSSLGCAVVFDPVLASSNVGAYGFGQVIDGAASTEIATVFVNTATPLYYRATV